MLRKVFISLCAIHCCWGQSFNSPPLDWIQTDGTGAYRFGYATGDEGRHYHVSAASADNTVAGRFGYKDPATGGDLQTTYTAGRRGFRARGPHIARRMDLSQNKPPFSRPDDDGQYHPELDNYFDPNEDRGFDYSYRTPDHIKEEHADRAGDVRGRYSYLDDIGFRHNVDYIAGSKTGFVVSNPVPDTFAQARGGPLYYVGKSGGSKVRGFTAIQKTLSGAYRFLASGPDHKRSEISDASGNRRGVYTYLDDKGVQHTVEYIAGPKIGYKVINNKRGFSYNPVLPYFPDSSANQPLFPSSTGATSSNKPLASNPTTPSPTPSSNPGDLFPLSPPDDSAFPSFPSPNPTPQSPLPLPPFPPANPFPPAKPPFPKPPPNKGPSYSSSPRPPSSVRPPTSSTSPSPYPFQPSPDFPSLSSGDFPSTSPSPIPAKPPHPDIFEDPQQKWNYDFDYFFNNPSDSNKDWSKPLNRPSGGFKPTSPPKTPTFDPFPDFPPSPFPDPSYLIPDSFHEGLNTAESGNGLKPPFPNEGKETCTDKDESGEKSTNETPRQKGRTHPSDNSSGSSTGGSTDGRNAGGAKHYYKGRKGTYYPSRGTVKFGGVKKNEWHATEKDDGYFAIPPGVAVRAHVQSLDIVPFKRFESPEEALQHHHDTSREARN